ncbi:MAG: CDP-alcohol phosphatidyltransferase family protein [Desulfurococcales archaeon]|nr:CDP-alcohol phosphatidyltransferase family protein [Desulfurococcales archaeon]
MGDDGDKNKLKITGKTVEGPVSKYINRRISRLITLAILESGIQVSPNTISWTSLILTGIACIVIIKGSLIIGGILVQLASIIDGVDGELARARGMASKRGAFLDTMLDRYADIIIYTGIILYIVNNTTINTYIILVFILALSGDLLVSYLHSKGTELANIHPSIIGPLDSIASRDVRLFVIAITLLLTIPLVGLILVSILSHIYVVVKSYYLYKML